MKYVLSMYFKPLTLPMQDFTLDDLTQFSRNEKSIFKSLIKDKNVVETHQVEMKPSEQIIANILSYNRAVSVRTTKKQETIRMVLN